MAFKTSGSEATGAELNFIGKGTVVEGKIITESSMRIDGKIKGNVVCKNILTIGENGEIEGDVDALNVNVGGRVKGKISVKQKLVLESKSSLIGDLKASKLIIDEGAIFEGTSVMGYNQTRIAEKEAAAKKES